MIRSEKTQTLTLSVFSVGLSYHEFQTGQDNIVALIAALNSVKEITMIDFNFTYRDESKPLSNPLIRMLVRHLKQIWSL